MIGEEFVNATFAATAFPVLNPSLCGAVQSVNCYRNILSRRALRAFESGLVIAHTAGLLSAAMENHTDGLHPGRQQGRREQGLQERVSTDTRRCQVFIPLYPVLRMTGRR